MATPSRRVPLCEREALGGGWCRPPAAPSSVGGGAAPEQSRPSPAASPERRRSARGPTLSTPGWEFGGFARVPGAPSGWGAGNPLSGAGLQSCGCVVGVGHRSRGRDSSSRYKLFGEIRGFGDSAR